jgi:ATP-dependent phosphofructokinase / diphosphate-dependent phosphofructokinase
LIEAEKFGHMVALEPPDVKAVPFDQILGSFKQVPLNGDIIETGRDIGICFGD